MKMKTMVLIGVVTAVVLGIIATVVGVSVSGGASSSSAEQTSASIKAVVVLNVGNQKSGVTGVLELSQENDKAPVRVQGNLTHLTPEGKHGFHVHQSGDIRGDNPCGSTGGHFNPLKSPHGAPENSETDRHVGDLGNIVADSSGNSVFDIYDTKISLSGPNSIIGRAFVVHEKMDDLGKGGHKDSLTTGNAGARLACGIIGIIFQ